MEISPRVHVVQLLGARGHLVLEPEITLIDAGLPGLKLLARAASRPHATPGGRP